MSLAKAFPTLWLVALLSASCGNDVTGPRGAVVLSSFKFVAPDIEAGDALILLARASGGDVEEAQPFILRTSSGASQQRSLIPLRSNERDPWQYIPDEELAAVISGWDNRVSVGFKEVGADQGVDDNGYSITSAETIEMMKQWLRQQGVTIEWEWDLIPGVSGSMPADPALVKLIRTHENIDYLSPDGPVELEGGDANLLAAFPTAVGVSGLSVRSGDVVIAEYRQPNGSVLRATASVR